MKKHVKKPMANFLAWNNGNGMSQNLQRDRNVLKMLIPDLKHKMEGINVFQNGADGWSRTKQHSSLIGLWQPMLHPQTRASNKKTILANKHNYTFVHKQLLTFGEKYTIIFSTICQAEKW